MGVRGTGGQSLLTYVAGRGHIDMHLSLSDSLKTRKLLFL